MKGSRKKNEKSCDEKRRMNLAESEIQNRKNIKIVRKKTKVERK